MHESTSLAPVTVALIDDHPVVLAGIESWYAGSERPIVAVAKGPDASLALSGPGATADVVVLDLQLAQGTLVYRELRQLVALERQVIVYTMRDSPETALSDQGGGRDPSGGCHTCRGRLPPVHTTGTRGCLR